MTAPNVAAIGPGEAAAVNLDDVDTSGPSGVVWGVASPQLNTNLVKLAADTTIDAHTNDEVDVLVVVQSGNGAVTIDGTKNTVSTGSVLLIPFGSKRSIRATAGLVYLSIHQRRSGPTIGRST